MPTTVALAARGPNYLKYIVTYDLEAATITATQMLADLGGSGSPAFTALLRTSYSSNAAAERAFLGGEVAASPTQTVTPATPHLQVSVIAVGSLGATAFVVEASQSSGVGQIVVTPAVFGAPAHVTIRLDHSYVQ